jgi:lysophospholipase L1-like esterase
MSLLTGLAGLRRWLAREPGPSARPAVRLGLEVLEDRTVPSAVLHLGVVGDSAAYTGTPAGANGDMEWTQVLQTQRPNQVQITNLAVQSATSASMISTGQVGTMANLIAAHAVDHVVIVAGSNDVLAYLPSIFAGNSTPFANSVSANIATTLDTFSAAGRIGLVVWNVPDIGLTPAFRAAVTSDPVLLGRVTAAVELANDKIEAIAASRRIPVFNVFKGLEDAVGPLVIDGVQINQHLFSPDGFHPSTAANGIVVDEILEALHEGEHVATGRLRLTDQEIFTLANIPHDPGHTYFDVRPYVILPIDGDDGGPDQ